MLDGQTYPAITAYHRTAFAKIVSYFNETFSLLSRSVRNAERKISLISILVLALFEDNAQQLILNIGILELLLPQKGRPAYANAPHKHVTSCRDWWTMLYQEADTCPRRREHIRYIHFNMPNA